MNQKMAQPVQPVNRLCSSGRGPVEGGQKVSLSPSGLLFPVEVRLRPHDHLSSIKCLAGDRWASTGPRSDLNRLRFNLDREEKATGGERNRLRFNLDREEKATGGERNFLASLNRSSTGRAQPIDQLNRLSHFLA